MKIIVIIDSEIKEKVLKSYVDLVTEYLYIKTEGFTKTASELKSEARQLEKEAVIGELADITLSKIPYYAALAGVGTGGLWWLMNRDRLQQEALHKARMDAVLEEKDKMNQKLKEKGIKPRG